LTSGTRAQQPVWDDPFIVAANEDVTITGQELKIPEYPVTDKGKERDKAVNLT
jgi:hypothetical protein